MIDAAELGLNLQQRHIKLAVPPYSSSSSNSSSSSASGVLDQIAYAHLHGGNHQLEVTDQIIDCQCPVLKIPLYKEHD
jgi:hypothetical protein